MQPIYKRGESINQYMKRVEIYNQELLKDRYGIILEFVNEWIDQEFTSLTDFKFINENMLLHNAKHNRDVIRKYSGIFENKFQIELCVDVDADSDEIKNRHIISIFIEMLKSIDYVLSKKELGSKIIYSVKKKCLDN